MPIELNFEIIFILAVLGVTVFLFVTELFRIDFTAIVVMVVLGIINQLPSINLFSDPSDLFMGFSSNAVISIIAVMIIGAGLDKTGLMSKIAAAILKHGGKSEARIIPIVSSKRTKISYDTLERLSQYLEKQKSLPPEVENRIPIPSFVEQSDFGVAEPEVEPEVNQSDEEDEIAVLDCEIEILDSESDDNDKLTENGISEALCEDEPPPLEEAPNPPTCSTTVSVLDTVINHCETSPIDYTNHLPNPSNPLSPSNPLNHSNSFNNVSPLNSSKPKETQSQGKRKKKLSEDIPNTLKIPEKRISRSSRECRAVIPYSIDNPKHFSIRK